jgi:AP-1 complex subunit beta-1
VTLYFQTTNSLLGDIFGIGSSSATTTFYIPPKQVWLPAAKGKGLEVSGTFTRKGGQIYMEMTLANKAMQPMNTFGIQLNKNSFGLLPGQQLNVPQIPANQSVDISLPLGTNGPVQRMDPLTNLQVNKRFCPNA